MPPHIMKSFLFIVYEMVEISFDKPQEFCIMPKYISISFTRFIPVVYTYIRFVPSIIIQFNNDYLNL